MDVAVSLQGLTRRFGDVHAVQDLSLDVAAGELFGVVGPDGAGKTTTFRMLAGVLRPSGGDATILGVSVARDPEGVKRHVAYMAQRFGLYTDLTVRENIEFYADLYGVPDAERPRRMERLYAFSGLGPFQDRLAGQLSGGMKQKLGLSAALIHQPRVMILDEPTFGVDPISRRDLWLIVHEMVATGTTVMVSTAYLDEAERCDRVALLHQGQLLALDQPAALQARLGGKVLAVQVDRPRAALTLLRAVPAVRQAVLFGDVIHLTLDRPERDWAHGHAALQSAGHTVRAVQATEPTLEDVFIDLVRTAPQGSGRLTPSAGAAGP
ncbi:MAG TPA: ABC transporter ATP-binding protein [Gemmatimonadales bacterium]|nr:ABC transporter ATP-binding protein [Gemmatimonadales bacterium]